MESTYREVTLSVIIPTLNEEKHIATVVGQFRGLEGHFHYEVIIGDGGSTDRTTTIASELGARVAIDQSVKKTVASGRNAGANIATGNILIFCDADTRLDNVLGLADAIQKTFNDQAVVAAVPRMQVFPEQQLLKDKIFHAGFNLLIRSSFHMPVPLSRGQCQIIRTSAFHRVGGYNPEQVHADDNTIFQHLAKVGKLRFLNEFSVYESPRRYRKVGYLKLSAIGIGSIVAQSILHRNVLESWQRVD